MPKLTRVPHLNLARKARPRPIIGDSPEVTPVPMPPETWNLNPETSERPWTNIVEPPSDTIG